MTGRDFLDPGAEVDLDSLVFEDLGDVSVGFVRERFQQRVAVVQQVDVSLGGIEVAVFAGDGDLDHVAQRARDLNASGTPAHHDDVERAALHELRLAIDGLEQAEDPRAQFGGVVERVQRERVLGRAGSMEEVRLRAGRQDQRVPAPCVSVLRGHGPCCRVHAGYLRELDVYVGPVREHPSQRMGDVAGGQLRGRHLIQQAAGTGGSCCGRSA